MKQKNGHATFIKVSLGNAHSMCAQWFCTGVQHGTLYFSLGLVLSEALAWF